MGYHLNRLDEPVFMAVPKPLLTEFEIHYRLDFRELCSALFVGKERVSTSSCFLQEFMIGLEHNSRGFLSDYLAKSTVTWPELCRVLTSISSGLAFLHSGLGVKNKTSALCHR